MLHPQHPKHDGNLELEKFSSFPKHLAFLAVGKWFLCSKNSLFFQMLQSQHPKQRNNFLTAKNARCFGKLENFSNSRFPSFLGCWDVIICAKRLFFEQRNHFLIGKNAKCFGKHENFSNSRFPAHLGIWNCNIYSKNSLSAQMLQSQHPKCGGNLELDKFSCFTKHLAYLGIRELFLCS